MVVVAEETPRQVKHAVTFLWAGLAFAGFSLFLDFRQTSQMPMPAATIAVLFIFFWSLLTIKIAHGRNWARITYLIFTIIGLPLNLPIVLADFRSSAVLGLITATSVAIPILGLGLLFTGPSKEWFKRSCRSFNSSFKP